MFKKIDHIELIPEDFDRALTFYTDILGFRVRERAVVDAAPLQEIAYIELGGAVVELMRVQQPSASLDDPWSCGYRAIALEVENMEQALAYLSERGVAVTWGPVDLGKSKRAEIKDSEGNIIELRQW
ncbi:VOC family protein [Geomonas sp. RF6]|uniref:VOC family protein n=1 Tax=Geomonas sp. RF6 TaxID=2897342 RepID=UPI001E45C265|nr:VOC family protein [Geomonas sp. RF6]UFS72528.1 VOC family protein [Geomonas sp. RF6]